MNNSKRLCSAQCLGSRVFTTPPASPSLALQPPGKPTKDPCSLLVQFSQQPLPAFTLEGIDVGGCYLQNWEPVRRIWTTKLTPTVTDDRLILYFNASSAVIARINYRIGSTWTVAPITTTLQDLFYYANFDFPPGTEEFGVSIISLSANDASIVRSVMAHLIITPKLDLNYLHYYNSDIVATVEDAADAFICAGMSLWTQYTGSDLVNGGEIAGYRYPPFNLTGYSDLVTSYQAVSSTPGALVGQLKHGAYGHYVPANEQELGYLPMEQQEGLGCIIIVGRKATADSSLRVNFNQYLIVSTTNQAFPKQLLPADAEALLLAYSMLRDADPVIKNDGHKAKISKALNWYKTHEKSIKRGLTTAAKLAKIAAPVIGSLLV